MGRRKKQNGTDPEQQLEEGKVPAEQQADTNKFELTEEQKFSLLASQYKPMFVDATNIADATKAEYDSAKGSLRTLRKKIIAEMGSDAVTKIELMIEFEQEGGEEKIKADIERKLWVARYMAAELGTQLNFLEDRTPAEDRAHALGKAHGLAGEKFDPSAYAQGTPQLARYEHGFFDGQEVKLRIGIKPLEDPPPIGDQPATHVDAEAQA
jgi:hypothetical protein